ncbi:MAG: rane protein [Solirubrobacterales bacterium]|nr:rane protein [Solirubrobacterales bacterium]
MKRSIPAVVSALALLSLSPGAVALAGNGNGHGPDKPDNPSSKTIDLAVIGDIPYGADMITAFPSRIDQLNADPKVRMVIHLGDIKNGSSRCDTSYFESIRAQFDRVQDPLAYTPGDNEWTDCHRANNGGYQPAGPVIPGAPVITPGPSRLDEVRRIFFPQPGRTLGQDPRTVESQRGPIVENVRWSDAQTQFGLIHVVGSDDDGLPWFGTAETPALRAARLDEQRIRSAAAVAWLNHIFDTAQDRNDEAVVIGIQADMFDPAIVGDRTQYEAFTPFVRALAARARAFKGPVLLLNGDSHVYGADRPLADPAATNSQIYGITRAVPNLQRVTIDGSSNANDYLRLHVDRKDPGVFSFERVPYTG